MNGTLVRLALALLVLAAVVLAAPVPADFAGHAALRLTGDGPWHRLTLPMARPSV